VPAVAVVKLLALLAKPLGPLQAYWLPGVSSVTPTVATGWAQVSVLLTLAVTSGTAVLLKTAVFTEAVAPFWAVTVTE
jgi:hypothetical protein